MNQQITITREWAMPSAETFSIAPIASLIERYLAGRSVIVDPFARNTLLAHHRNDLNPETLAEVHMPAEQFADSLARSGIKADAILFDPPYSPRQIMECYQQIGKQVGQADTQHAGLIARSKDSLVSCMSPGCIAICCGWNSAGFGKGRGFELLEILIVNHGGSHNDTIVTVERKAATLFDEVGTA